jgi:acetyltransferase-like isoleucine patch superfamily enzyme
MSIKSKLQRVEFIFTGFTLVRWIILLPGDLFRRALWFWGRLRFSVLVRDRGLGCVCHWGVDLKYPDNLHLGQNVVIGVNASLGAHSPIHIGDQVRISKEVQIETAGLDFLAGPPPYAHASKPIVIEQGVWIGTRAIILGGVRLGAYSVVAAGSLVTRDVPARTLVGGVPARVLKDLSNKSDEERQV